MSDDTTKPPHERPTLPELASANDTDPPPPPSFGAVSMPDEVSSLAIPAGQAQSAFAAALDDLQRAFNMVEATGMAAARALDSLADQGDL